MKLSEFNPQYEEGYHFESSQSYCDPAKVDRASASAQEELDLNANDRAQLEAITALETLRYRLAKRGLELREYQQRMHKVVRDCNASCGKSPFDPTEVHNEFYEGLNAQYHES